MPNLLIHLQRSKQDYAPSLREISSHLMDLRSAISADGTRRRGRSTNSVKAEQQQVIGFGNAQALNRLAAFGRFEPSLSEAY